MTLMQLRRTTTLLLKRLSLDIIGPVASESTAAPMEAQPHIKSMDFELQGNLFKYHKMGDVKIGDRFVVTRDEALKNYEMQVIRKLEKLSSVLHKEKVGNPYFL